MKNYELAAKEIRDKGYTRLSNAICGFDIVIAKIPVGYLVVNEDKLEVEELVLKEGTIEAYIKGLIYEDDDDEDDNEDKDSDDD